MHWLTCVWNLFLIVSALSSGRCDVPPWARWMSLSSITFSGQSRLRRNLQGTTPFSNISPCSILRGKPSMRKNLHSGCESIAFFKSSMVISDGTILPYAFMWGEYEGKKKDERGTPLSLVLQSSFPSVNHSLLPHEASPLQDDESELFVKKKIFFLRRNNIPADKCIYPNSFTNFWHWVPFPAPGPPWKKIHESIISNK